MDEFKIYARVTMEVKNRVPFHNWGIVALILHEIENLSDKSVQ